MHPLETVHLGDIVELPDGRQLTARARVKLPMPLGSMAGFVLLGEFEAMCSIPPSETGTPLGYHPLAYLPDAARAARAVFEGACSYWAPHLPGQRQAMGEVLYKVLELAGSVDPVVIVWRGPEAVIFVRGESYPGGLRVKYMPREREDVSAVDWRSSEVVPVPVVPESPAEIGEPAPARPVEAPVPVGVPHR